MKTTPRKRKLEITPTDGEIHSAVYDHAVIRNFLNVALMAVEKALNDSRAVAMTQRDDRLSGIILYQRHQVSCIRDLIAQNDSREAYGASARPNRGAGTKS